MLRFTIVLLSLSIFFSIESIAQKWSKLTQRADESFIYYEFFAAIEMYNSAYKKAENKEEKAYITYKIAECYRMMNDTKKAEVKYKSAIGKKYNDTLIFLYYADMLKYNEKYLEAEEQYKEYLKYRPDDKLGLLGVKSCSLAAGWYENPTRYIIGNIKEINTKESEFGPAYAKSDYGLIYFTSTRKGVHPIKINKVTGQNFTDLFQSNFSRKELWEEATPLNDTINTVYDEGTPTLTQDGTTMYFVRCRIVRGEKLGCQIYMSSRSAGGDWTSSESVPITADSISVGQPSITNDECTLYFVSSGIKDGYGDRDIWKITRESTGKPWSDPINLGPEINTERNEMYPYIREDGALYFASDGHPGMGGIDIFKAKQDSTGKWEIDNMKYPINSSADDFGIIFKGINEEGLFTSSRKESTNVKDVDGNLIGIRGKGSDDIYSFLLPPMEFSLRGTVIDNDSEKPIEGAKIQLVGSDGTSIEVTSNEMGKFKFKLIENNDYLYIVKKEGYLKGKGKLTTNNQEDSKKFTPKISLSQIGKPIEIENIFYEFAKWDLTEDSKKSLNELIEILNNNGNITIELGAHTDMIGDSLSNIKLSQKRAESVVNYLIEKGIAKDRLTAKGYGKSVPKTVTMKIVNKYDFLKEGDVLSPAFIKTYESEAMQIENADEDFVKEKVDVMNQLNRRTEFKVISTKYIPF
ncbi:MAG: OmpA family protein [Bacteroidota bacterium]